MAQMVSAWREAWSTAPLASTSALFPFGIVSLAGGTSVRYQRSVELLV